MERSDHYISILSPVEGEYKEKGSKFLAYAFPVRNEEEMNNMLRKVKKDHPKARHHCFAYRLGADPFNYRTYDDGEPSGTAGRPILGAIDSEGLSDTGIIVVRYFGGTKLGASGLFQAYRNASADALRHAMKKEVFITRKCKVRFEYSHMGIIMDILKQNEIPVEHMELNENPYLVISIRSSLYDETIRVIKGALLGRDPQDVDENTKVSYCTFEE